MSNKFLMFDNPCAKCTTYEERIVFMIMGEIHILGVVY